MTQFTRAGSACAILAALTSPAFAQDDTQTTKTRQGEPTKITLDQIEARPEQYAGKTVTVTGEVSDVLGPHLFTVDDGRIFDFHGDTLVFTPAPLAALVTEGTPVVLTGVVQPLVESTVQREWSLFTDDPAFIAEIKERSGIVAQSVAATKDDLALVIDMTAPIPPGTAQTDLGQLVQADERMVGKRVQVQNARVEEVTQDGGFWVTVGNEGLFVLPETPGAAKVTPGQTVTLEGVVLPLPDLLRQRLGVRAMNEEAYVYARQIAPASS